MEPLTLSLLGRFFGVPLLIIALIVGGAITVVLLFGAPASPTARSVEALLQAAETGAGIKSMGMLLPPDKEYWQTNLELAERIEKQEFTAAELTTIAERLAAVIRAELAKRGRSAANAEEPPGGGTTANSAKIEFLIRAIGKTKRPEAVATLHEVLSTQREPFVRMAIQQLADLHHLAETREVIPALLALLQPSHGAETRMMAAAALSVLATSQDRDVLTALNQLQLAEEGEVAWNAALALARLGSAAGKSTLLDLLDREFWEKGQRYQVADKEGQVRRFAMPPQRVDELLKAAMEAAAHLDDPDLWALIERLQSDTSLTVRAKAMEILNLRQHEVESASSVAG